MYSKATIMDEFHINFNIFGKYGDFESWQKAELTSPVKKSKREESREEGEAKRHKVLDDRDVDKIKEDQHKLSSKKSTVWAKSVLKDCLEDFNFSGRLFNIFVVGLANYISLLKNTMNVKR